MNSHDACHTPKAVLFGGCNDVSEMSQFKCHSFFHSTRATVIAASTAAQKGHDDAPVIDPGLHDKLSKPEKTPLAAEGYQPVAWHSLLIAPIGF